MPLPLTLIGSLLGILGTMLEEVAIYAILHNAAAHGGIPMVLYGVIRAPWLGLG